MTASRIAWNHIDPADACPGDYAGDIFTRTGENRGEALVSFRIPFKPAHGLFRIEVASNGKRGKEAVWSAVVRLHDVSVTGPCPSKDIRRHIAGQIAPLCDLVVCDGAPGEYRYIVVARLMRELHAAMTDAFGPGPDDGTAEDVSRIDATPTEEETRERNAAKLRDALTAGKRRYEDAILRACLAHRTFVMSNPPGYLRDDEASEAVMMQAMRLAVSAFLDATDVDGMDVADLFGRNV